MDDKMREEKCKAFEDWMPATIDSDPLPLIRREAYYAGATWQSSRAAQPETIMQAQAAADVILANFKTEGNRTKAEEWQACYAMLFKQFVELTEKVKCAAQPVDDGLIALDMDKIESDINRIVVSAMQNDIIMINHLPQDLGRRYNALDISMALQPVRECIALIHKRQPGKVSLEKCAVAAAEVLQDAFSSGARPIKDVAKAVLDEAIKQGALIQYDED